MNLCIHEFLSEDIVWKELDAKIESMKSDEIRKFRQNRQKSWQNFEQSKQSFLED